MIFQIGDIVSGNNPWLLGLLGVYTMQGVIICAGTFSSKIHLFTIKEDIVLMNDYIEKIPCGETESLKVGDLVELKPRILTILKVGGVGTIIEKTIIRTNDFYGNWTKEEIEAFVVFFPSTDCEYTIPCGCLRLFSKSKID